MIAHAAEDFSAQSAVRGPALAWLAVACVALLASTVYAVILVVARIPWVNSVFAPADLFHTALVLHVNLAVTVWFLAFAGLLWTLFGGGGRSGWSRFALAISIGGLLLLGVSPVVGPWRPVLSDYVPVLAQPVFLAGLGLFVLGTALMALRVLWPEPSAAGASAVFAVPHSASRAAAAILIAAVATAMLGALSVAPGATPRVYFQALSWGAGHVVQVVHMLLLVAAWGWLASIAGLVVEVGERRLRAGVWLIAAPAIAAPLLYIGDAIGSQWRAPAFTVLMIYAGSAVALLVGLAAARSRRTGRAAGHDRSPAGAVLVLSLGLFVVGIATGALIRGDNAMVPAHYHGTVGAVTLAYMGVAYHVLAAFDLAAPAPRIARAQAVTYAAGLLLLVAGLVTADLPRKAITHGDTAPGLLQGAGSIIMGLGGVIALTGQFWFLLLVARAFWRSRRRGLVYRTVE